MTEALVAKSHSKFGPSKAHRWMVCSGSSRVAEDLESEWAALGTKKHTVLDCMFKGSALLAGDIILTEAGEYEVTAEVLAQCQQVVDFVDDYKATHPGWSVETETRVEIGHRVWPNVFLKGECDGTVDAAAYCWDELLVLDAKFGWVKVYPRGNAQLYLYAAGLLEELSAYPIKWVTVCIAQPDYSGEMVFREHRMTREEVEQWTIDQLVAVERAAADDPTLTPDDKACQWCPARAYCPARLQWAEAAMLEGFSDIYSVSEMLEWVPRLKAIAKDIEQRAMRELNEGKDVRGWKLVESNSRRKWPDEDGQATSAAKVLEAAELAGQGLSPMLFEHNLKSPAEVEKVLYAHFNKAKTKKEVKAMVDKVAVKPTGAPKLVPSTDERPAIEAAKWSDADILAIQLEESLNE